MRKKAIFLLTCSLMLMACSGTPTKNSMPAGGSSEVGADRQAVTSDSSNNPVKARVNTKRQRFERITNNLLRSGQRALLEDRLLTPEGDNANLYFQVVLGRDPGNYQATIGIAHIVDRYLEWAVQAAQRQDFAAADRFLRHARTVNDDDPAILEVAERVRLSKRKVSGKGKRNNTDTAPALANQGDVFRLPADLFEQDDTQVLEQMRPIIERVTSTQRPITINWPNDREGRLLYQIINSRTPEFRVRAMINHSSKRSIEVKSN